MLEHLAEEESVIPIALKNFTLEEHDALVNKIL
mgnify:CR=1 FL=1